MLKNIQLEINFKQDEPQSGETGNLFNQQNLAKQAYRGSKDFIKQMRGELDEQELQEETQEKEP